MTNHFSQIQVGICVDEQSGWRSFIFRWGERFGWIGNQFRPGERNANPRSILQFQHPLGFRKGGMPCLTNDAYDLPGERVTRMGDPHISHNWGLSGGI